MSISFGASVGNSVKTDLFPLLTAPPWKTGQRVSDDRGNV
jgi:hypothetical protein